MFTLFLCDELWKCSYKNIIWLYECCIMYLNPLCPWYPCRKLYICVVLHVCHISDHVGGNVSVLEGQKKFHILVNVLKYIWMVFYSLKIVVEGLLLSQYQDMFSLVQHLYQYGAAETGWNLNLSLHYHVMTTHLEKPDWEGEIHLLWLFGHSVITVIILK